MAISSDYRAFPAVQQELTPPVTDGFADAVEPARFPNLELRFRNQPWAERVGLGELTDTEWENAFARFEPLPENQPQPLALRYHGHQFQSYNPQLGDGRGFLYAQLEDAVDRRLLDLGTKGSGKTPYSRGGDGRLTLKGAVREVLATEMLESLGVYTSKTFSVFETGESLERHDEPSPTRGAVLTRLSHSHVRYGTFQRFAYHKDPARVQRLIDYCIEHFYPQAKAAVEPTVALLREVTLKAADLTASWMTAGFVHGVLNTDNMNITGESFDYGPYRFIPTYNPQFTAAYFDSAGLYAYGRQPESVLWNLEQLAGCFALVADKEKLIECLQEFAPHFNLRMVERFIERIGVESQGEAADGELFMASFNLLAMNQVNFEQFFHDWYGGPASRSRAMNQSYEKHLYQGEHFEVFLKQIEGYKASTSTLERLENSYFQRSTPCSLLIDEIEAIWDPIAKENNWKLFEAKIQEIREMGHTYGRRFV